MASVLRGAGTQCPVPGQCPHLAGNGVPSASHCLAVTAVGDLKVMGLTEKRGQIGHILINKAFMSIETLVNGSHTLFEAFPE